MVSIRRVVFIIFCLFSTIFAEEVVVTGDDFYADEVKLESILTGNVDVQKGKYDNLKSDKLTIYFDQDKNPTKYIATGNAKFKIILNEKHYDGKGDELTYEPKTNFYTLTGNAYLHEVETNKQVHGYKITVDQNSGTYRVFSGKDKKSPAKLIFQIEDKN